MEKASNGQFREFIGKLLVKGSDERIAQIDKIKIQNVIDFLSSNPDIAFGNLVDFINNGFHFTSAIFESKVFKKTSVINVKANPKPFHIKKVSVEDFFKSVSERERDLGNSDSFFDGSLWSNHFFNRLIAGFSKDFSSTIYRLTSDLTHRTILYESENAGINKIYTYIQALSIIRQSILNGEVDVEDSCILVYFRTEGYFYHLRARRNVHGNLDITCCSVVPTEDCEHRDGVCFK